MRLVASVIDDEAGLAPFVAAWDAMAVEAGRPCCAPAWMLAWWRHARPEGSGLRVVVVTEGGRLVGILPLWAARDASSGIARYEMLASEISPPVGPLVAPGREPEVGRAMSTALADATPRPSPLRLWDGDDAGPVDRIVKAWPRRHPWVRVEATIPVPVIALRGLDYEGWFAGRSAHFRQESRRCRRRLDDAGARFGLAGPGQVEPALDAFLDLHRSRWGERSGVLVPGVREMLGEAAAELAPCGRLRVFTIAVGGELIAVNVFLAAGEEVSAWNCGFDQAWRRYSPSMQLDMHALADAFDREEARMSLGPGDAGYKPRLANCQEEIAKLTLIPRGPAFPLTWLSLAPGRARRKLRRRIPSTVARRLRGLVRG